jgi:GGDEF domain-containing protein
VILLRLSAGDDNAGLRTFAGVLRDTLRAGDLAYRVDGGEFAALLTETESGWGKAVAGRLRSGDASPFRWGEASFPSDGDDPETLLEIAGRRLEDS